MNKNLKSKDTKVINNRKAHKCFEFKHIKYFAFKVRYKRRYKSFNSFRYWNAFFGQIQIINSFAAIILDNPVDESLNG